MDIASMLVPPPDSSFNLAVLLFVQIAVILCACRIVGYIAAKLGQSQVVSEMIAGVLLGPSLFGLLAPGLHATVFPKESMPIIYAVSQIGLVLYMFTVGLELNVNLIRSAAKSALSVSVAGMVVPFALGAAIAWGFRGDESLFSTTVSPPEAMLYMGAAMCITAFPMLARIIAERGIAGTRLGTIALAAGSSDDAAAWCLLAVVLASFKQEPVLALAAIGGGLVYLMICITAVRPVMARVAAPLQRGEEMSDGFFVGVMMLLAIGSWFTDAVGIYAVFGAFMLGAVMPRGMFAQEMITRIRPLTVGLLLPLFFCYSGLNTRVGLVNTWALVGIALLILAAACLGKGGATYAAARLNGSSRRDAFAIGALMNSRGLMELIILNIGLQSGVITPTLFSIMVVMAIVTTLIATPLFVLSQKGVRKPDDHDDSGLATAGVDPALAASGTGPVLR